MMPEFENHGLMDWFDFYRKRAMLEAAPGQQTKMKNLAMLIIMAYYPQVD